MIEFASTPLDLEGLRAAAINERLLGNTPQMQAYSGQGYAGADPTGYNANWLPVARHPDNELALWQSYLWARSYEQHRNNVMVYGPTEVLAEAVGELVPTSRAIDPGAKAMLQERWKLFAKQAGSDGVSTWGQICESMVGNACQGGDVGVQYDDLRDLDPEMPLRIRLHDAYRINSPFETDSGETARMGVVYRNGVESAYYVARDDSTTGERSGFYRFDRIRNGRPNFDLFRRPDASRRPGQSRGVPIIASILNEAKELGDYRRSSVRGAGKRSRLTTIIKSPDPSQVQAYFQRIKTAEATGDAAAAAALREGLKPNLITTPDAATLSIPNFMEVVPTPTDVADSTYEPFLDANLGLLAGAYQLPKEVCYQIWKDANFARARILYLRQGRTANRWRSHMVPIVGNKVWTLFVQYVLASDRKLKFSRDLFDVEWHGPTQEYQDFATEISAEAEGRSALIDSPQGFARRTGKDAFVALKESIDYAAKRKEMMAEMGVTDSDMVSAYGPIKSGPTAAPATKKEQP